MFNPVGSSRPAYICSRCLRQQQKRPHRPYSSSTTPAPPPPPPSSGATHLPTRRLLSLHGPEAPKFLQGIITNNVRADAPAGFFAAFLTAQGKVLNDVFVYPTLGSDWHKQENGATGKKYGGGEPGYLVEFDGGDLEAFVKHVKRHKLRARLEMRVLEEGELGVWSAWRGGERWTAHSAQAQGSTGSEGGGLSVVDSRAPGMGQRILVPSSSSGSSLAGNAPELEGLEEAPLSAYTIRRYLRGVPEGQNEIPREEMLPMNANFDLMKGIDFKKGCYVGQELTIRTHHTGVVRRRILPVALYDRGGEVPQKLDYDGTTSLGQVEHDTDIRRDDTKKRATGKLIGSVGNVGLGMCRLEQMTDLVVSGEGTSFSPEDRFFVPTADGTETGLKAFVPDWIRGQIRAPKVQRRVE